MALCGDGSKAISDADSCTRTVVCRRWVFKIVLFSLDLLATPSAALVLNMGGSSPSVQHLDHEHKNLGIVLVATASLLSGLSAALTQRALTASSQKRHVFLLSAEMAVYGILFLLVNLALNSDVPLGGGLLSNWTLFTVIPVATNVSVCNLLQLISGSLIMSLHNRRWAAWWWVW